MIVATEADIGRRVIYDPEVKGMPTHRGTLVGIGDGYLVVRFDFDDGPLDVISNLRWADE